MVRLDGVKWGCTRGIFSSKLCWFWNAELWLSCTRDTDSQIDNDMATLICHVIFLGPLCNGTVCFTHLYVGPSFTGSSCVLSQLVQVECGGLRRGIKLDFNIEFCLVRLGLEFDVEFYDGIKLTFEFFSWEWIFKLVNSFRLT